MPIYNTLEEALADQPAMRYSLLPPSYTPSRSDSAVSLDKQRRITMPLNMPRPSLNTNCCGGSGSIHDLSPLFEEENPMESIGMDDLQPADHPEAGRKVQPQEGDGEKAKNGKKSIWGPAQVWFTGYAKNEPQCEMGAERQSWVLKCGGKRSGMPTRKD